MTTPTNPLAALDALGARRVSRRGTSSSGPATAGEGPFDRRITANHRISVTALVGEEVDLLALRPTMNGIVLTTDVASGVLVGVHSIGARREAWLRGPAVRAALPKQLMPRRERSGRRRSVPVDVYRRVLPDGGLELEIVCRGMQRSPW